MSLGTNSDIQCHLAQCTWKIGPVLYRKRVILKQRKWVGLGMGEIHLVAFMLGHWSVLVGTFPPPLHKLT